MTLHLQLGIFILPVPSSHPEYEVYIDLLIWSKIVKTIHRQSYEGPLLDRSQQLPPPNPLRLFAYVNVSATCNRNQTSSENSPCPINERERTGHTSRHRFERFGLFRGVGSQIPLTDR